MDKVIASDLYRYHGFSGIRGFFKGLFIPGFRYMYCLRNAATSKRYSPGWFFWMLLLKRYSYKYGFQIPSATRIGHGFYIGHFGAIVINAKAVIGNNCNVAHGVTIGQANRGRTKGFPVIGDCVWIGTGAVIVGKITIGSNVLIAPNSFVNTDVPDNSIVIGNPARIIPSEKATDEYINYTRKF